MSEEIIREHISIVHAFLKYQLTHDDASLQPIVHWRNFPDQGYSEVIVVTWDRERLFARVTGSFSACSLNILKADIFTRADDIAIETFYVATERLEAVTDPRDKAAFEKILGQAMSMEQFDFSKAFAKRVVKPRFPAYDPSEMPTRVSVDLRASRTHALLDVQTADYPGLLYRIASAIAESKLNLVSARVTTEKGAALDTFYLTDQMGRKVESDEVLGALIEEVRKRVAL
jgi:[protein-PII] uridylyltransferase